MSKFLAFLLALLCAAPAYSQMFTLRHTFNDPTPTQDSFGSRIRIDGDRVLVSAHSHDSPVSSAGEVHLFDINSGSLLHTFVDSAIQHPTRGDSFGAYLDFDGSRVVIGEIDVSPREVYLFDAATGVLSRVFRDPLPGDGLEFGYDVAVEGDRIAIGERHRIRIVDANTGVISQTIADPSNVLGPNFGLRIEMDQGRVLVSDRRTKLTAAESGALVQR